MKKENQKKIKKITLAVMNKLDWTKVEFDDWGNEVGNVINFKSGWRMFVVETTQYKFDEVGYAKPEIDKVYISVEVDVAETLIEEVNPIDKSSKWVIPENISKEKEIVDKILKENGLVDKPLN